MGKGDKRSKRGKLINKSYGKSRPKANVVAKEKRKKAKA